MNLIVIIRFMRKSFEDLSLLQQNCLVDGGLNMSSAMN